MCHLAFQVLSSPGMPAASFHSPQGWGLLSFLRALCTDPSGQDGRSHGQGWRREGGVGGVLCCQTDLGSNPDSTLTWGKLVKLSGPQFLHL